MNDIFDALKDQPKTFLGRIAANPSRLMTVREWWYEMDEPVTTLCDPQSAFEDDERTLSHLCADHRIPHREASNRRAAAYPAWLYLVAIPANP